MKPALIFQDKMVLQRNQPIPVWGSSTPHDHIRVSIQNAAAETAADEKGRWMVWLPALSTSFDETMRIRGCRESLAFCHVAVGEVWLAGGQSNMEFHMRYDRDFDETVLQCENENIRFFDYPEIAYEGEESEFDYSLFGFWRAAHPDHLQYFSAVGYYFAREVFRELQVPIGIVGCNWGGTRAACWMDEEFASKYAGPWLQDYAKVLEDIPDIDAYVDAYKKDPMTDRSHPFDNPITDRIMYGVSAKQLQEMMMQAFGTDVPPSVIGPVHEWRPCGLFHTMLEKVIPYGIRGVLWYQGESDAEHASDYTEVMTGLIACWRKYWNSELPFVFTQLAPYGDGSEFTRDSLVYPKLRQCQEEVGRKVPLTWCTSIGDVGSPHDIHPKEKQPVGRRMALLALHHVYGLDILCEAPTARKAVMDGDTIAVDFDSGDGLYQGDMSAPPVELTDRQGERISEDDYTVSVGEDRLLIRMKRFPERAAKIDFAETPYHQINIFNRANIPVKPFSLDITKTEGTDIRL